MIDESAADEDRRELPPSPLIGGARARGEHDQHVALEVDLLQQCAQEVVEAVQGVLPGLGHSVGQRQPARVPPPQMVPFGQPQPVDA